MNASVTSLVYLVAAVLFILALRGLSHPETSRRGNQMGMAGMAIAILATLIHHGMSGSGIGLSIARQIALAHQGQLEAQNTSAGARFVISLPAPEG